MSTAPISRRVVFNGRFLAQVHTGVQRYAAETLRALDHILREDPERAAGTEFILAVPDDATELPLQCIRCVKVPGRGGHAWEQWALGRFARGAYLVNFNYSAPLWKRDQLVTIHDATVRAMPQAFTRSYRWWHNATVALLGRRAESVMTVSDFSRHELKRWFGLKRNDILVGREGGEHANLPGDDATVLRRHGLESGRFILGVGSVKPNKNFELVGKAMRLLPDYPWPVAIAGAKDIGIFRDSAPQPDGFRFLGFVPDNDLAALYRHAAWFVFPSLYEGFGLPAVEAMANGCPVLAATAASIPEVCGDAALYFDPNDAATLAALLRRVVDEPGLRAPLVAEGRRCLERYNWRANAEILLDHLVERTNPAAASARRAAEAARRAAAGEPTGPRIVHVTECLASGTLGFLAQATRELATAGVRQTLLYSRRPDTPDNVTAMFDPRVTMIELPPLKDGLRHYARELRRSLAQELATPDEDVRVHLHSSKAGFLGRVAMMGLPQPKQLLYSPHGLVFLNKRWIAPSLVFRALEWLAARVVRSTPVGCGRSEADLLTRISPTPAVVLENAVDNVFFGIQRQVSEPPVVASMGRICYQKAPEQFAEMAVRFEIAGLKARFVWIGSGEPAQEARLRAAGVTVTGWVDRDEIRRWLAECAVYVQTSRWEGMPLSVLQALAAGVPCVVTDVVGNRDAVRQGITGFVADTPESMLIALRRLLQDEELHARMSAAAQADAHERFSNASFRERLLQLYGIAPEPVAKNVVNILRPAAPSTSTSAPKPSGLAAAPRVISRG